MVWVSQRNDPDIYSVHSFFLKSRHFFSKIQILKQEKKYIPQQLSMTLGEIHADW